MNSVMSSIMRANTRKPTDKLNVLTYYHSDVITSLLCATQHNIYLIQSPQAKWEFNIPTPDNLFIFDFSRGDHQIPLYVDIDVIFIATRDNGITEWMMNLSRFYHLPMIIGEDVVLRPDVPPENMQKVEQWRGDINVFANEHVRNSWLFYNDLDSSILSYDIKHSDRWKKLIELAADTLYINQRHFDV